MKRVTVIYGDKRFEYICEAVHAHKSGLVKLETITQIEGNPIAPWADVYVQNSIVIAQDMAGDD